MTDQSPAVSLSHPPAALMRIVNPPARGAAAHPARRPDAHADDGRHGHRTQDRRQYTIPLTAHVVDGILYAMTTAAWKNNFRDGATAQVLHNGTTATMHGELITDPDVVAGLAVRCAQSYGAKRAQTMMGLKFRDNRVPTLQEFTEAVERERYVAVRFTN
jgi:hypothetical protein